MANELFVTFASTIFAIGVLFTCKAAREVRKLDKVDMTIVWTALAMIALINVHVWMLR